MTYLNHIDQQFRYHWASNAWTKWSRHSPRSRMIQAINEAAYWARLDG